MKRYSIGVSIAEELEVDEDATGEWVRYEDVRVEMERLRSPLRTISGQECQWGHNRLAAHALTGDAKDAPAGLLT